MLTQLFLCGYAKADDILEVTGGGASSANWNSDNQWTGGAVPTDGNNYVVNTNTSNQSGLTSYYGVSFGNGQIRTLNSSSASDVFLGDNIIIPPGSEILMKNKFPTGVATANIIFTNYNNVSDADAVGYYPMVRLGANNSGVGVVTLDGTIKVATDAYIADDYGIAGGCLGIASTVSGTNNLFFMSSRATGGTYSSTQTNILTGDWSEFTGTLNVGNSTVAGSVEMNNSAVNVNMSLAMPLTAANLRLDKGFSVKSLAIVGNTVAAGTYTPTQLAALGYGGNFAGSGSLTVGFTAPPDLTATPDDAQVSLTWSPVYGAVSYNVKRSTASGAETIIINVGATNYTDTGLTDGTTYYYEVSAVDGSDSESGNSTEVSATPVAGPPSTPAWVSVTTGNPAQVDLTWTAAGGTTFFLMRGTASGTYDTTNVLSTTNYVDTQVLSGTTYYYAVSATNVAGAGPDSVETNAAPSAPPFSPTSLTAMNTGNGQVTLSWNSSFGATSYNVKRSTSSGAETTLDSTNGTSYVDTGLANNTTYYYEVSAVGAGGESANSTETSIVTGFIIEAVTGGGSGTTWNDGSQWNGGNAPDSGVNYVLHTNTVGGTGNFYGVNFGDGRLRTPANNSASVFLGGSLIMPPGAELLVKETSGGSASANILFSNFNNISSSSGVYPIIRLGPSSSGGTATLGGTITNLCDSYISDDAGATMTFEITSTVVGASNLTLVSSANSGTTYGATRTNLVTGDWSGFTGTLNIGNAAVAGTVELNNSAVNPNLTMTMLNTNGALILDQRIHVAGFSIGGNSLSNGTYTPTDLADLGYGGNFAGTGVLVVGNQAPVAGDNVYPRNGLINWKISVSDLLTNVTDVDGDPVSLTSVSVSTNGVTLAVIGGYVQYSNPSLVDDQFSYTVTDGFGGTNSATITLTAAGNSGVGGQISGIAFTGGAASMTFAGIPGYKYNVQVTTNLINPIWTTIWTTNAPTGGVFLFQDNSAPLPTAYYRLMWNGN